MYKLKTIYKIFKNCLSSSTNLSKILSSTLLLEEKGRFHHERVLKSSGMLIHPVSGAEGAWLIVVERS